MENRPGEKERARLEAAHRALREADQVLEEVVPQLPALERGAGEDLRRDLRGVLRRARNLVLVSGGRVDG